jgi:hypothetical protein
MIEYGIHVIDDETLIRDSIAMALEETYRIETFAEAEPAIKAMEKGPAGPGAAGHRPAGHGRNPGPRKNSEAASRSVDGDDHGRRGYRYGGGGHATGRL